MRMLGSEPGDFHNCQEAPLRAELTRLRARLEKADALLREAHRSGDLQSGLLDDEIEAYLNPPKPKETPDE